MTRLRLFRFLFLFLSAGLRADDNTPPRVPTKIDKITAPTGRTHTQIGTKLRFLNTDDKTDFASYLGAGGGSGDVTADGNNTFTGTNTFNDDVTIGAAALLTATNTFFQGNLVIGGGGTVNVGGAAYQSLAPSSIQAAPPAPLAGTVEVEIGALDTVVGTGTSFTSLAPGDAVSIAGTVAEISSITNDTELVLTAALPAAVPADTSAFEVNPSHVTVDASGNVSIAASNRFDLNSENNANFSAGNYSDPARNEGLSLFGPFVNVYGKIFTLNGTPTARFGTSLPFFIVQPGTDDALPASTEVMGSLFQAQARRWATGNIITQRQTVFEAPTLSFFAASTIGTAINVDIAEPIAGTDATFTKAYALRAASTLVTGAASFGVNGGIGGSLALNGSVGGSATINVPATAGNGTITLDAGTNTFSFTNGTASLTIQAGSASTITGGGTLALGGFTLTVPATGTAVTTTTINNGTLPASFTTLAASGTLSANTIALASGTTATLFNATATTVNAFGAGTTIGIGATTGAVTINNNLNLPASTATRGQIQLNGARFLSTAGTESLFLGLNSGNPTFANFTGARCFALGVYSGSNLTSATDVVSLGRGTLYVASTGANMTGVGTSALSASNASYVVGIGGYAGYNSTGTQGTFIGAAAGLTVTSGTHATFIGSYCDGVAGAHNYQMAIGAGATVTGTGNYQQAIGAGATVSTANTMVLGRSADTIQIPGAATITAAVGIGGAPNANAMLDIQSTTKALIVPRMTKTQRDAITKISGMLIYQTDNTPGLRVCNGSQWVRFTETAD